MRSLLYENIERKNNMHRPLVVYIEIIKIFFIRKISKGNKRLHSKSR